MPRNIKFKIDAIVQIYRVILQSIINSVIRYKFLIIKENKDHNKIALTSI